MQFIAARLHLTELLHTETHHTVVIPFRIGDITEAQLHYWSTGITLHVEFEFQR